MTTEPNIETLMQAEVDGQLTQHHRDRLHGYLVTHPAERARLDAMIRQASLMRASVPWPEAERLSRLTRLARVARHDAGGGGLRQLAAAVALFALGLGSGMLVSRETGQSASLTAHAPMQAAAAHALYAPEILHPVEVFADQRDHLQSWLSNRLGAPVIAPELGDTGYRLVGGRLLPLGDGPAAFFLYQNDAGERLSLSASLAADMAQTSFHYSRAGDLGIVSWQDGRWRYSIVGPAGQQKIETIARKAHEELI